MPDDGEIGPVETRRTHEFRDVVGGRAEAMPAAPRLRSPVAGHIDGDDAIPGGRQRRPDPPPDLGVGGDAVEQEEWRVVRRAHDRVAQRVPPASTQPDVPSAGAANPAATDAGRSAAIAVRRTRRSRAGFASVVMSALPQLRLSPPG